MFPSQNEVQAVVLPVELSFPPKVFACLVLWSLSSALAAGQADGGECMGLRRRGTVFIEVLVHDDGHVSVCEQTGCRD